MDSFYFEILILLAAIGSGLVAGIFFAFSTFVMSALGRLAPEQGIAAMQTINITVINPWFLGVFMGTALGSVVLAVAGFLNWGEAGALYLVLGGVLYFVGCFLVTVVFNVPLNNALAEVDPASEEGASVWTGYLSTWTMWNHVRTAAPLAAMVFFVLAYS